MIGKTLNHYKIIRQLGSGGMGEVYLAEDTSLDRQVALKVLPSELASDPERRQRFEREAKAIAALDHPNIVVIHSVEEAEGIHFITMQLVEGKTLSELIPRNGFPLEKFFDLAIPLADAVSAAHEQGIVHRDLKPANIMVSDDGRVRVLDFGLAKLKEEAVADDATEMATVQATSDGSEPLTEEGKILGTVAYMSPEQAEGKHLDHRTDIFSLGIILYEMATGERPFKGDTKVSVMSSIVKEAPTSVTELNRNLPRHLGRIVKHSLEKDVTRRYQAALDLRNDLEELKQEIGSGELVAGAVVPAASRPLWRRAVGWGAGVAVGAIVAGLAVWVLMQPTPQVQHWEVQVQSGTHLWGAEAHFENTNFGLQRPSRTAIALSPDGTHLVYAATDGEETQLYLHPMNQPQTSPIPGTEGGCCPFFSPDGQSVGFFANDGTGWSLERVTLDGGEVWTIVPEVDLPFGASWGADDTIVFANGTGGGLLRVSALGGTPDLLTELDSGSGETSHRLPHFLPSGDAVLFTVKRGGNDFEIVALSLETDDRSVLVEEGADPRYVPTGHLVFAREGTLMAVAFDLERLEISGDPVPILGNVMHARYSGQGDLNTDAAQLSISNSGSVVYVPGGVYPEQYRSLQWVDREGETRAVAGTSGRQAHPRVSPDGRYLAYEVGSRGEQNVVWLHDTQSETSWPLSTGGGRHSIWSPDSRQIAFSSRREGNVWNLYSIDVDGTQSEATRLTRSDRNQVPSSWSRDGVLAFLEYPEANWPVIYVLPMEGEGAGKARPFLNSGSRERYPTFSPNGKWLAYTSEVTGEEEVYVSPYPGPGQPKKISTGGGFSPAWSRDGRELFYRVVGEGLFVVEVAVGEDFEILAGPRLLARMGFAGTMPVRAYDVTQGGDFVMVLDTPREKQSVTQINVILNWFEELKRLVPGER